MLQDLKVPLSRVTVEATTEAKAVAVVVTVEAVARMEAMVATRFNKRCPKVLGLTLLGRRRGVSVCVLRSKARFLYWRSRTHTTTHRIKIA